MSRYLKIEDLIKIIDQGPFVCYFTESDMSINSELHKRIVCVALRFNQVPCYRLSWRKLSERILLPEIKMTHVFYIMNSAAFDPIENPSVEEAIEYFKRIDHIIDRRVNLK